ncbi:nucleotidyltransferase family protein [Microcoleus sp. PH2017_11_PCY_U_A]|uniref:nucleotidyltransferase family protein n=1 Tax=unclassified Microcoleus TaxID=2642155 RepID=UPI003438E422
MKTAIALPIDQITKLCQHWQIIELSLFGSILRDDFHAESDIDILVAFAPTANWGLLDHAQMQEELEAILSKPVDLISKRAIAVPTQFAVKKFSLPLKLSAVK